MKLVLAGSHQQYMSWLAEGGRSPGEYRPVRDDLQLRGVDARQVQELRQVGTYWDNPVWGSEAYRFLMDTGVRFDRDWAMPWEADYRRAEALRNNRNAGRGPTEAEVAAAAAALDDIEGMLSS